VNPQTRDHVLAVAKRLGYRRHVGASSLREGGNRLVGVVLETGAFDDDPLNPKLFWPRFLNGFVGELNAAEAGVVLVSRENLGPLAKLPMDALVVLADLVVELSEAMPFGMPIIGGTFETGAELAVITHDYAAVAREALGHLRSQGATQVAAVVTEVPMPTQTVIYANFEREAIASGLGFSYIDCTTAAIEAAVNDGTDAIVTTGHNLAGTIAAVRSTGRSIPEDVLFMSLSEGNIAIICDPPVTTLSFRGYESGRRSAQMIAAGLDSGKFESILLPYELVIRESTGGPRRSG